MSYYDSSHAYQQTSGGWAYPPAYPPAVPGAGSQIGAGWGQDIRSMGGYNQEGGQHAGGGAAQTARFAAYDTSKNRNRDTGSGFGGKRSWDEGDDGEMKRPRWTGRVGREPELTLYINPKFTYWNLPAKAKVLLVSNLHKDLATPERVFNLFSFYGDVERVKVMRRRAECALVQFTSATFAAIARDYLDNFVYKGEQLVVSFSKFDRVKLPHESRNPNDGITKDFSGPGYKASKRYATVDMMKRGMKKICKPTKVLHLGGLNVNTTPAMLTEQMQQLGVRVVDCVGVELKKVRKGVDVKADKMSGYVELATEDDAVFLLSQLGNSEGMRVTFADDCIAVMKVNLAKFSIRVTTGNQKMYPN